MSRKNNNKNSKNKNNKSSTNNKKSSKNKKEFKRIKLVEGGYYGKYQYAYPKTGKTVRELLNDKKGCKDGEYRIKQVKKGVKILLCITEKQGKRGGHTKALAILRDDTRVQQYKKHYQKKEPQVLKAETKKQKLHEKLTKKDKSKNNKNSNKRNSKNTK